MITPIGNMSSRTKMQRRPMILTGHQLFSRIVLLTQHGLATAGWLRKAEMELPPNLTIILDANSDYQHITIPYAGGSNQTTFITNPNTYDCGPGCSTVHAFEASDTRPWWYECNITVSPVNNATLPQHQMGQPLAHMAAAGIALQGHVADASQA